MILKADGLLRKYIHNIFIAIDQLLGALLGGDPDETISSRVGKWSKTGSPFGKAAEKILDWALGCKHCTDSIESDEGKDKIL